MSMTYHLKKCRKADDKSRVYANNLALCKESGELKPDPGLTKQEFSKQCDINTIVARFTKLGTSDWLERHKDWVASV